MIPILPCPRDRIDSFLSSPSAALVEAAGSFAGAVGVLGAGGKMGLHVASMLRQAMDGAGRPEVSVTAVSRFASLRSTADFEKSGIATIAADLLNPAALGGLPDFGTVIFLAGMKFGSSDNPALLKQFNEEMPAMVARRYKSSVIVALSTGCVYPFVTPASGGSRESDAILPSGEYAISCMGREKAFEKVSLAEGTPTVVIRLNYSVEFRYGVLVDIAQKVLAGEDIDVTTGYVNVIWQRDAVDHILRSIALARSPAIPLNVTGLPIVSVREIAGRFGRLFGKAVSIVGTEDPTAWLNNPEKAHGLFGPPPVSLDEMTAWVAAWLLDGGETLGKPTKFERRDGKF